MFGIGGSEIIVILIVALLFLGPDKLPDAAKQISKGIRDLKRGTREIQQTIENDETIGGALRDIKSALRGEEAPPPPRKPKVVAAPPPKQDLADLPPAAAALAAAANTAEAEAAAAPPVDEAPAAPAVRLPPEAGEVDPDLREGERDREELAALIRPASGTVAKGAATAEPAAATEPKHG